MGRESIIMKIGQTLRDSYIYSNILLNISSYMLHVTNVVERVHNTACTLSVATNEEVNNLKSYYCLECKVTAKEFSQVVAIALIL